MNKFILIFILFGIYIHVHSQSFYNGTNSEVIQVYNNNPFYGGGVSFADFNRDGWDDLTFCIRADSVVIFTNNGSGDFVRSEIFPNDLDAKHPTWVDYDNDGDSDFFFTRNGGTCKLYRNEGDMVFTDVTADMNLPMEPIAKTFGACWGDYDNDGWLDVYLCNYNFGDGITNWLMHSNGDGTFEEVAGPAGVDNGQRASFQAVWNDFNFDGLLDLYVVNDKFHQNFLYQNTGSGAFTDVSVSTNADASLNSMCNSVSDFENDHDWDIYISNTNQGNWFLQNDNNVFTNTAGDLDIEVFNNCWASLWIDFDNDQDEDLHVANAYQPDDLNDFFVNQGDGTFNSTANVGLSQDNMTTYSSAKGDYNHDGFYDFILHNLAPDNATFWVNNGIGGNSYTLGLQGTVSNRDGIGTRIEYWVNNKNYMRFAQCGENYLGQDSQYEILSLGSFDSIDSLFLFWPSGWVDKYFNLEEGDFNIMIEGSSWQPQIIADGQGLLCEGGTLLLDAGNYESFEWSTGSFDQTIVIDTPGTYSVLITNEFGLTAEAGITIEEVSPPALFYSTTSPSCNGFSDGSALVEIEAGNSIMTITWENNDQDALLENAPGGYHHFILTDENGCTIADSVFVDEPLALSLSVITTDVVCYGQSNGTAQLLTGGGTGLLTPDWMGFDPAALPMGEYEVMVMDENLCSVTSPFIISQPDSLVVVVESSTPCFGEAGIATANATGGNGDYTFDFNGANPDMIYAGSYSVTVIDQLGCTTSQDFVVAQNPEITATSQVVNANNGNNGSALVDPDGGTPPYTYQWSNGSQSSVASGLGQGTYSCLITDEEGCTILIEVNIIDLSIPMAIEAQVNLFPNPFGEVIIADIPSAFEGEVFSLKNSIGQTVATGILVSGRNEINASSLAPGIYVFSFAHLRLSIAKQ